MSYPVFLLHQQASLSWMLQNQSSHHTQEPISVQIRKQNKSKQHLPEDIWLFHLLHRCRKNITNISKDYINSDKPQNHSSWYLIRSKGWVSILQVSLGGNLEFLSFPNPVIFKILLRFSILYWRTIHNNTKKKCAQSYDLSVYMYSNQQEITK